MADKKQNEIHLSYKGEFKGALEDIKSAAGNPGVKGTFVREGDSKIEATVTAYGDKKIEALKAAHAAGGTQILRGTLIGSKDTLALNVYATGPETIKGRLHQIRTNGEGKGPFVAGYFVFEKEDGKNRRPSREFQAFGEAAESLKGVTTDHIVTIEARVVTQQQTKNDEPVVDAKGKPVYEDVLRAEGNASLEASVYVKKEKEESAEPNA